MTKELEYKLFRCKSLQEFVTMFFGLGMKEKQSIFTEVITIKQDTKFYRIRRAEGIKEPNDPKEWGPPPSEVITQQGRFNEKHESVLYVASHPDVLGRELNLQVGEEYYLAEYKSKCNFAVGSFLANNCLVNTLMHEIAMAISNADDLTEEENKLVDEYYSKTKKNTLRDMALDKLVSFYIYKELPNLYNVTNKLGKLIMSRHKNGIRYSSVYTSPLELSGGPVLITFDGVEYGNYVLSLNGSKNLELVSVKKKTCEEIMGLDLMIKEFSKDDTSEDD